MTTEEEAKFIYEKLDKRIYKMVKRFEKENSVLVTKIEYQGDLDGSNGTETSEIETEMCFFR